MTTRRVFLGTLAGGLIAAPLDVQAQPAAKVWRIGLLGTVPPTEAARFWSGFFEGLQQLGYVEGRNIVIEGRYSEGRAQRLPSLAAELVRLKVDVIVTAAYTSAAAKGAT